MRFTSSGKLAISVPTIKKVAFALFSSRQSRRRSEKALGPSSKVRATDFFAVDVPDLSEVSDLPEDFFFEDFFFGV